MCVAKVKFGYLVAGLEHSNKLLKRDLGIFDAEILQILQLEYVVA